jgi:competence protein ComEC
VVPLAIFGSLLNLDFVLQASHFILEICMYGLNYLANLPTWKQAYPPMWTLLVAMFGMLWLLLPRGFPQRWLGIILLLPLFFVEVEKPNIGEMRVAVLDVGQGLAVVIQTKNHTLLYDAGSRYSAQSDAGSKIVVPYLRGEGVKKLDGFIVSHDDIDHSGGAASVLAQVPVSWLASSFDLVSDKRPKKTLKCFAGQHWAWDNVSFEVLHPSLESYENAEIKDNNRSCVIKVTSQFGSILLTGDIEKEAEKALLEHALQANIHKASGDAILENNLLKSAGLQSDALIVPHHGSKTSSTVDFVQAVGAKYSVFTVGYLNRFKHPKPLIEKRFEENGAFTYRSDYQGAILIDFKKNNPIKMTAWRQSQPRYWHDSY